jgi:hypothetical protein
MTTRGDGTPNARFRCKIVSTCETTRDAPDSSRADAGSQHHAQLLAEWVLPHDGRVARDS